MNVKRVHVFSLLFSIGSLIDISIESTLRELSIYGVGWPISRNRENTAWSRFTSTQNGYKCAKKKYFHRCRSKTYALLKDTRKIGPHCRLEMFWRDQLETRSRVILEHENRHQEGRRCALTTVILNAPHSQSLSLKIFPANPHN